MPPDPPIIPRILPFFTREEAPAAPPSRSPRTADDAYLEWLKAEGFLAELIAIGHAIRWG